MITGEEMINLLGAAGLLTIIALVIVLVYKMERIKQLQAALEKLRKSLDEMDEQAKLIVRTDMELNRTQEELDKKVASLYALQRLSRQISTTLEENQIFKMIEAAYLEDLGFEKALGFLYEEKEKKFLLQANIGFLPEELSRIRAAGDLEKEYRDWIKQEKAVSSNSLKNNPLLLDRIKHAFAVNSFIISPILPKDGNKGFIFVGTEDPATLISEGDEELVTILANQLGQALENARLFEKTWRAQQDLEEKVEERTQELTSALGEVQAMSRRKTDFISSVSHELRTPLTSIKGYASILLAGKLGDVPAQVKERLEKINRHSDELVHMVNGLLDIARIESGRMAMKKESLELSDVAAEVADLLGVQLKEKHIEFSFDIPKDADIIPADRNQIARVFINIIGNAIKFTPEKGKITVHSHNVDSDVQIDISDNGCGIPPDAQGKLFEEFYRVDNPINEQVKGTGLGLALVKRIIEAHNGKIWVKSKVNAGTTFSFTLPRA